MVDFSLKQVAFRLGPKKRFFMEQLEKDATFLAGLNIMDYSLLIGIHDRAKCVAVLVVRFVEIGGLGHECQSCSFVRSEARLTLSRLSTFSLTTSALVAAGRAP
jgi:hypothetical protein